MCIRDRYLVALAFGIIDLTPIKEAAWFALPNFEVPFVQYQPKLYLNAITTMAPIAFVTMTEHIGHLMVLNKLTKRNFFQDPGLSKTLMGDGLAQIVAGFVGGPPVTSYGENIGVLAITRVQSVFAVSYTHLYLAEEAQQYSAIIVSAGKRGMQIELAPEAILSLTNGQFAEITTKE